MKKILILAAMAAILASRSFGGESSFSDAQVRRALNLIYDCFEGPHLRVDRLAGKARFPMRRSGAR